MPGTHQPRLSGLTVFFYVFVPFAFGHFLSSLLRNANAVLAPHLVGGLQLSAAQLGLLTSAFFLTFALVQLPVGIALDRHGPRKVQLVLMLIAAGGTLMFARGTSFIELLLARAVIGIGLGGCFMSAVKAISSSIATHKLPSVHGYLIAVGGLGAATATTPVRLVLQFTDWRGLFVLLAALVALAAVLIWIATPRTPLPTCARTPTLQSLRAVYQDPAFRRTISLMLIPHAVFFGVQGLWVGRWLSDVARFSDAAVAFLLYLSMAAVIFGAIGAGMLTEWAGKKGVHALDVAAIGIAAFILIQFSMACNLKPTYQLLAVLFTLVGTITGIEYAIVAQSMPPSLTGRASTCLNLLIFAGAFLVQALFGQVLSLWTPVALNHYPAQAYQCAFGLLVLLQLPGLIHYVWGRRTPRALTGEPTLSIQLESGRPSTQ